MIRIHNVHLYITYIGSFKKKQFHREIKRNIKNIHVLYFYKYTYLEFVNLVVNRKKRRNTLNTKNGENAIHLRYTRRCFKRCFINKNILF